MGILLANYPAAIVLGLSAGSLLAAQTVEPKGARTAVAPEVVVSATRDEAREFDLPLSIDSVDARIIREDNAQVNLSEFLNRVPGIVVQNRQNYAQDLQVSSRGFGARAAFGVRGVRLVADGIPATMPDGQGQTATFNLSSAARVEVLRGPFASLYGNASGGFVQAFTEDGPVQPSLRPSLSIGSYRSWRAGLNLGGTSGALNYVFDVSRFETDGYRDHSAAQRDQLNGKFRVALANGGKLTAIINSLHQPDTQDPLGLTRAQFEANPRQATAVATTFNTRKSIDHRQAGAVYEQAMYGTDTLRIAGYGGARDVRQYLSIPLAAQNAVTAAGGVVDLDREFGGLSLRYTVARGAVAEPFKLTWGLEHDRMDEHRRGFINNNGVAGLLKRDQDDRVTTTDLFAIAKWQTDSRWMFTGGARASRVRFTSDDHFIVPGNPDDSGAVRYRGYSWAAGVLYKINGSLNVYANVGRGFETPTLAELSYRPGGASGLNFELQASRSEQLEAGIKANLRSGQRLRLAVFEIRTKNEIVVNSASGGRTDFKNAGRTERQGLELSWEADLGRGFEAYMVISAVDARYRDAFTSGTPPVSIAAGNRLPGVAGHTIYGELVWRHALNGFHAAIEARRSGAIAVDDLNSESADAYVVASLRTGFEQRARSWRLREFLRVDNLADRRYAGSVIVADANRRFYEPAPGRNYLFGIEAVIAF
jgi:iron complex outermembrane receptor protein